MLWFSYGMLCQMARLNNVFLSRRLDKWLESVIWKVSVRSSKNSYLLCVQEQPNPLGCQPFGWVKCKQRVLTAPAVRRGSSWSAAGEQLAAPSSDRGASEPDRSVNTCLAAMIRGSISILPLLTDYEKWS